MILPDPIRVTLLVTQVLEKLEIPYLVGGSFASTMHGRIRTTQDVDIIAEMQQQHVQPFVNALQGEFYIDEQMMVGAVIHHSSFNIIHRLSMFKVDVFIPARDSFTQSQLNRARKQIVTRDPEASAYFASPEDTVLAKMVWFRIGGDISEKQWEDVMGIMQVQSGDIDFEYLRKWGKELKILDLVEKAIEET